MFKKTFAALGLLMLSVSANAALYDLLGEVTLATGAFAALTPPGTPVAGPMDLDGAAVAGGLVGPADVLRIDVNVGGFCFATNSPSACPLGGADVPIISIDNAALTFDRAGNNTGGPMDVTAFSPTYGLNLIINFDFSAGTFFATDEFGQLGTAEGRIGMTAQVIPIPAAAWLFGSALLGLAGAARRRAKA